MLVAQFLFWGSIVALAWLFVGYPVFVLVRGVLVKRRYETNAITPDISIVVAAYNEADSIRARIENLLSLDYPNDRVQIIVASDGSSDGTVPIASEFANRGVTVLDLPRAGKIPAVNTAMSHVTGEIVVMTDANSDFEPQTLRELVAPFSDSNVGGVAGNQVYQKNRKSEDADGERAYWNLDRLLKRSLSNTWSVISATGAVYAIRRELVQTIPSAVTDDFFISTGVIDSGKRLVFAPNAIAIEPPAEKTNAEFARKVRVMTRGFRGLWERKALFNPVRTGFYAVDLFTYKLLKRLIAVPLFLILVSTGVLARESNLFLCLFAVQCVGWSVAVAGWLFANSAPGRWRPVAMLTYFAMVNLASLRALLNSVRGQRIDRWEPQRGSKQAIEASG